MQVLLLGATGNLGSRLVPALLTHNHRVVAFVRSASKLEAILPAPVFQHIQVIEGDAADSASVKRAILENECNAVVSAAGVAAMAPWGKSELPKIFRGILEGVKQAGAERGSPLRVWFMGGMSVLYFPGTESMLLNFVPIYLEHRQNLHLLKALPLHTVHWSMLCPSDLTEESSDLTIPTRASSHNKLIAEVTYPPAWKDSWLRYIPLLGKSIVAGMNAPRYVTTLEQNAELIASDLASDNSRFANSTVGVIDASRQ